MVWCRFQRIGDALATAHTPAVKMSLYLSFDAIHEATRLFPHSEKVRMKASR